jgi:eukaryotic-like serine/threonine-protein kinase
MPSEELNQLTQLVQKLGLATETQLQEAMSELGHRETPEELLHVLERKAYLTSFQIGKLKKGDPAGFLIGGYRILYKIASGTFGRVYRADDAQTGQVVAIKILRRRHSENPHTIELFEREGRVGLSLSHPNIVETLAVSQDLSTKQYYIVMEFIEGGNLRDFLEIRGKLQPAEAFRFMEESVAGIAHAYSRGVTHRDLKLTNILISSQGTAKVVDFGLAGIFSRKGLEVEGTEKVDRTVDYAGLERATGVKTGDVRSDIYFLGCILYEMLTGRSPLVMTKDPRQRMSRTRFDSVAPMGRQEVNAPPSAFKLVERMMSLDPHYRYQTPSQLLDAIRLVRAETKNWGTPQPIGEAPKPAIRSVFVVEKHEAIQDALRNKFKEMGYRVFVAADPMHALERFRLQPYDALVLDAGTAGEEGRYTFEQILLEAERQQCPCTGILILSEDQGEWAEAIEPRPNQMILVRPVTLKQVVHCLQEAPARAG